MGKILLCAFSIISFLHCSGQAFKDNSELRKLTNTYKVIYFDEISDTIDQLTEDTTFIDSGYLNIRGLSQNSPIRQMLEYFKIQIYEMDSADLSKRDSGNLYSIDFTDSLFYRNSFYFKNGKILKLVNFISVPHFNNEASIYYLNDKPYKSFWVFTKYPYLEVCSFYFFNKKCISDDSWEGFKAYAPFEYLRAIDLLKEFKRKFQ